MTRRRYRLVDLREVAACVVPGRTTRLRLTSDQRRDLNTPDGRLALRILRAMVAARDLAGGDPLRTPFAPEGVRRVAHRLGLGVIGRKRARRLRNILLDQGLLVDDGRSYRPAYTNEAGDGSHRVTVYEIPRRLVAAIVRRPGNTSRPALSKPMGSGQAEEGPWWRRPSRADRWWRHELFGGGVPPDGSRGQRRVSRSLDEQPVWARAAAERRFEREEVEALRLFEPRD